MSLEVKQTDASSRTKYKVLTLLPPAEMQHMYMERSSAKLVFESLQGGGSLIRIQATDCADIVEQTWSHFVAIAVNKACVWGQASASQRMGQWSCCGSKHDHRPDEAHLVGYTALAFHVPCSVDGAVQSCSACTGLPVISSLSKCNK